ncbi:MULTISPECIES: RidA family protein [Stenotrophomonas]|jgi:enamine deaminase RidA (YjgF/YER057c/UK114 family)|uniref:RidA family protein n=1 Tax=Stenotrophomonas TaxID=40323 RepID=UPI0009BCE9E9|nr:MULTISPECIES: RidA family protein [Stenotrophomonas]MDR2960020.1 RidA family protein [Stenotrophomonas sp.]MDT3501981.1 RidA family protein [Stenotrophomonas maltophilia]
MSHHGPLDRRYRDQEGLEPLSGAIFRKRLLDKCKRANPYSIPEKYAVTPYARNSALPTFLNPEGLYDPAPNGYSHVALPASSAWLVFIAGQGGEDAQGRLSDDFRMQVRQALQNLQTALRAVHCELSHVVKQTVLIVDHSQARLEILGDELAAVYGPGPKPACTLIPVSRLALDGMLFEVEAIASVPA